MTVRDFWIRKTEVEIEGIGIFRNGTFDGTRYDLDIYFEIKAEDHDEEAFDVIKIYNLSDKNRQALPELLTIRRDAGEDDPIIRVSSGYNTQYGQILWGQIESVKNVKEKTGDICTTIEVHGLVEILDKLYMVRTYEQGQTIRRFFQDISNITGYPIGYVNEDFQFGETYSITTSKTILGWIKHFEQRTKWIGDPFIFTKVFDRLYWRRKNQPLPVFATMTIDGQHGLKEITEKIDHEDDNAGYEITCFLIPGVFEGLGIELDSSGFSIDVQGKYVVKEYSYISDKSNHDLKMSIVPEEGGWENITESNPQLAGAGAGAR